MQHEGEIVESVDETLSSGHARLEASRRIIDDLDRRLHRASKLLGDDPEDESPKVE
jgi:hypothetical protein